MIDPAIVMGLGAEIDALRSENAALMAENESLHDVHDLFLAANARVESLQAENEALRADAERYRWLRDQTALDLRTDGMRWTRQDGSVFISSHILSSGDTRHAPYPSLDATIDAAMARAK